MEFQLLSDTVPPQAPCMTFDDSLSSIQDNERPFESTEMLDRTDKTVARLDKKAKKSTFFPSDFFRRRTGQNQQDVPRIIQINQAQQQKFMGNGVSTAKYNPLTFLPKFLYVEFSKSANLFFLFISCIQVCVCHPPIIMKTFTLIYHVANS